MGYGELRSWDRLWRGERGAVDCECAVDRDSDESVPMRGAGRDV